jgi:hypothetical protein
LKFESFVKELGSVEDHVVRAIDLYLDMIQGERKGKGNQQPEVDEEAYDDEESS